MTVEPRYELKKYFGQRISLTAILGSLKPPVEMNFSGVITLQNIVLEELRLEESYLLADHIHTELTPAFQRQIDAADLYEGDRFGFKATVISYTKTNRWWQQAEFLKLQAEGLPMAIWVQRQPKEIEDFKVVKLQKVSLISRRKPNYVPHGCGLFARSYYESQTDIIQDTF